MHGQVQGPVTGDQSDVLRAVHEAYDMKRHTRSDSQQAAVLTDDFIAGF
jgi:hypothetical protein